MQLLRRIFKTAGCLILCLNSVSSIAEAPNSQCFGTTSQGKLKYGVILPKKGDNFVVFSELAWHLGRTYVHSKVAEVVLSAYQQLATQSADKKFMYAETGWIKGGKFSPHKTHQNGLSVDFMVPVVDKKGNSAYLPITVKNKLGYNIEFDAAGKFEQYTIDFNVLALHLKVLNETAKSLGFGISRVFFDPKLQKKLFATEQGDYLKANIKFNTKQAWVRHDEHYHVDFDLPCESL